VATSEDPILTETYETPEAFSPPGGCTYLFSQNEEERGLHVESWRATCPDVEFASVLAESTGPASIVVTLRGADHEIPLRSDEQMSALWRAVGDSPVYLDITAMQHRTWAPLLRSALRGNTRVRVVYAAPVDYRYSTAPYEGQIYDLSERIQGLAPLPGFASLSDARDGAFVLVALLGFEGTRLAYLIEQLHPGKDAIIPVVGVPGYRVEYPFHAYLANKRPLLETDAWLNVHFAPAHCPFSAFYLLERIALRYGDRQLKVAPIGTKPHALGAVLHKLAHDHSVEIVYDHPIHRPQRTSGTLRLYVYHVSGLAAST